eukprot:GHRR01037032.1.p1 GENE.GHRR01037032.1~~GHRR01037032.1.p1  ORF type:complete len:188 (+),score=40.19 GHRR01037032.1:142-705(+)
MADWGRTGPRFRPQKADIPGPGAYDPKLVEGWKADPKSGFLGDQRFRSQELSEDDVSSFKEVSPPRQRKSVSVAGSERKYSWATQRIAELTQDLDKATRRVKDLEKQLTTKQHEQDSRVRPLHDQISKLEYECAAQQDAAAKAHSQLQELRQERDQGLQQLTQGQLCISAMRRCSKIPDCWPTVSRS